MPLIDQVVKRTTAKKTIRKVKGGDCDAGAGASTFTPTTRNDSFMYGPALSDIGGSTVLSSNDALSAASLVSQTVSPIEPNYVTVNFGQGVDDPLNPSNVHFVGGAKKKKAKRNGKKKAGKKVAGNRKAGKKAEDSPWMLTQFKIKVANSEGKKVVKSLYYNASTGEYRLRKMIKKGRKKIARFTALPKAYDFVR